jgi:hypothetical protein
MDILKVMRLNYLQLKQKNINYVFQLNDYQFGINHNNPDQYIQIDEIFNFIKLFKPEYINLVNNKNKSIDKIIFDKLSFNKYNIEKLKNSNEKHWNNYPFICNIDLMLKLYLNKQIPNNFDDINKFINNKLIQDNKFILWTIGCNLFESFTTFYEQDLQKINRCFKKISKWIEMDKNIQIYTTPTYTIKGRVDGFGAQYQLIMAGIAYCKKYNYNYIDSPLNIVDHVNVSDSDHDVDQVEKLNKFINVNLNNVMINKKESYPSEVHYSQKPSQYYTNDVLDLSS